MEASGRLQEPVFTGAVILLMDNCLCTFFANLEAPYPAEHSAASRCSLTTNCS